MARYSRKYNDENLAKGIMLVIIFFALILFGLWKSDRNSFWLWIVWSAMFISAVGIVYILWLEFKSNRKKKMLTSVQQVGAEKEIFNFIESFGHGKKAEKKPWRYAEYTFTWNQLDSLRKRLHEMGVQLSITDNYKDIGFLLRYYIYHKADNFVRESIAHQTHTFSSLNPSQFEDLLRRLYEAMGYSVMRTGKTGDMGSDLVVNMADQRAVVQAKQYSGSVSPAAIQQAVGALKAYNCTKAFVVTNSYFTPEAIQLAKVNEVGLVSGERLREMLLQYLKESWS
jgi:hypothetical protein